MRDFAILTMLVRLGMRRGEVAGLRLDDIAWRAGEIVVRGKGQRVERLPLPADVGEAVAIYLRVRDMPTALAGSTAASGPTGTLAASLRFAGVHQGLRWSKLTFVRELAHGGLCLSAPVSRRRVRGGRAS